MPFQYPPVGFHFRVEFGFLSPSGNDTRFQEVSGISQELAMEEVTEGGENRFVHRLPTRAKYGNLILKRGLLIDSQLIDWIVHAFEGIESDPGRFEPTTVNVSLLNENHEPLGDTYRFAKAWPVKWAVSDFKAQESGLVVETLELTYNYFTRVRL